MQLVVGSAQVVPGQLAPAASQPSTYLVDAPVLLTLDVTDDAGGPVEPSSATLAITAPDGTVTTGAITRRGVGRYTAAGPTSSAGVWRALWTTTGAGAGAGEWAYVVEAAGSALPYAATVEGVRARVLDVARPAGAAPTGGTARAARVNDARIVEWLLEGGARVARKLRLIGQIGAGEDDPVRLEYRAAARGLTELYAAALLWDATYPQAAKGERYGAVLFERFESGLKELAADLSMDFESQPDDPGPVDGAEPAGVTIDPYDLLPGYGTDVVIGGVGARARFPVADRRISRHRPW